MANGRGRRSVPRTEMGTFGAKRTGGSSSKQGGSGLSGFRSTRNTARISWERWAVRPPEKVVAGSGDSSAAAVPVARRQQEEKIE
jgi:hypothetical protein